MPPRRRPPPLTLQQILLWAQEHRRHTGELPRIASGAVHGTPGETWARLDAVLRNGDRGLPGGSSLRRLLAEARAAGEIAATPLTVAQILAWADDHRARTGGWPKLASGSVLAAPGETWRGVNDALRAGLRGLHGGDSLANLLSRHRGPHTRRRHRQ